MKHKFFFAMRLAAAGLCVVWVASTGNPVQADVDPLRQVVNQQQARPNVLLVVDRSASLVWPIEKDWTGDANYNQDYDERGKWLWSQPSDNYDEDYTYSDHDPLCGGYFTPALAGDECPVWRWRGPSRMMIVKNILGNTVKIRIPSASGRLGASPDWSNIHNAEDESPPWPSLCYGEPEGALGYGLHADDDWPCDPEDGAVIVVDSAGLVSAVASDMNLGFMAYGGTGVRPDVDMNVDDNDITAQNLIRDEINAYMETQGNGGLEMGQGEATTNSALNAAGAYFEADDEFLECGRKQFIILLNDGDRENQSEGCSPSPWNQVTNLKNQDNVFTFVIGVGDGAGVYELNRVAYLGRTDAEDADLGLNGESPALIASFDEGMYPNGPCGAQDIDGDQHNFAFFATDPTQLLLAFQQIFAAIISGDHVTAAPVVTPTAQVGRVHFAAYMSSAEVPGWMGHLRAFSLQEAVPEEIWDAGVRLAVLGGTPDWPASEGVEAGPLVWSGRTDNRKLYTSDWNNNLIQLSNDFSVATAVADISDNDAVYMGPTRQEWEDGIVDDTVDGIVDTCMVDLTADRSGWYGAGMDPYNWAPGGAGSINAYDFIDWLRGDPVEVRYKDAADEVVTEFRVREWILGTPVGIVPNIVQKPMDYKLVDLFSIAPSKEFFDETYKLRHELIYLPTDDGFLHAIDTVDGAEVFAYIPPNLFDTVAYQYCTFLKSAFDNEGSPDNPMGQSVGTADHIYGLTVSARETDILVDVGLSEPIWRTVMFLATGIGGTLPGESPKPSAMFALDITHPYYGRSSVWVPEINQTRSYSADPHYGDSPDSTTGLNYVTQTPSGYPAPLRVMWNIRDKIKVGPTSSHADYGGGHDYPGLGQIWSPPPVGLLNDPRWMEEQDGKRRTYILAFGSYLGTSPENYFWVLKADTGELIERYATGDTEGDSLIGNSTLPGTVLMETGFEILASIPDDNDSFSLTGNTFKAKRFFLDSVVTRVVQADMNGKLWVLDIENTCDPTSGGDPGCDIDDPSTWAMNWDFNQIEDAITGDPIDTYHMLERDNAEDNGRSRTPFRDPIYYNPAVGHMGEKRFAFAFPGGAWGETDEPISTSSYSPHLYVAVTDNGSELNPCAIWTSAKLDVIEDPLTNSTVFSANARVTSSPLLIIDKADAVTANPDYDPSDTDSEEFMQNQMGTALFTIYDPTQPSDMSDFCGGASFVVVVEFETDVLNPNACVSGSTTAIVQIGVGFVSMAAGPDSPILAVSGVGEGAVAGLEKMEGVGWQPPPRDVNVLSIQRMKCDY